MLVPIPATSLTSVILYYPSCFRFFWKSSSLESLCVHFIKQVHMVFCSHVIVHDIHTDTKLNLLLLIPEVFQLCKSNKRFSLSFLPYFPSFCVVAYWCLESIRLEEILNLKNKSISFVLLYAFSIKGKPFRTIGRTVKENSPMQPMWADYWVS